MASKTRESGRADILVRMEPKLKARIVAASNGDGVSVNDWLLDGIEQLLAARDTEIAAGKKRADLERRRDLKFEEIMTSLAGGDLTSLTAQAFIKLQEKAEAPIEKWRNHTATFHHAEPRSPIEVLCRDYCDLETELEGVRAIGTFGDEGLAYDPDDPDDGDEPEPGDEPGGDEPEPGDPDDGE
jgi:hypothetical protein